MGAGGPQDHEQNREVPAVRPQGSGPLSPTGSRALSPPVLWVTLPQDTDEAGTSLLVSQLPLLGRAGVLGLAALSTTPGCLPDTGRS